MILQNDFKQKKRSYVFSLVSQNTTIFKWPEYKQKLNVFFLERFPWIFLVTWYCHAQREYFRYPHGLTLAWSNGSPQLALPNSNATFLKELHHPFWYLVLCNYFQMFIHSFIYFFDFGSRKIKTFLHLYIYIHAYIHTYLYIYIYIYTYIYYYWLKKHTKYTL